MKRRAVILLLGIMVLLCRTGHSQTQREMNETTRVEYEKADARLNSIYKKLAARLDPAGKKKLIAAERAWIADREKQAKEAYDADEGGSIALMDYFQTSLDLTESRIQALEKQLASLPPH